MKALPKVERLRFVKESTAILEALAIPHDGTSNSTYKWQAMTRHGRLFIAPDDYADIGSVPSVCMRFEDTKQPLPHDANPYSGKWNIHQYLVDHTLSELRRMLAKVSAMKPTADELAAWQATDAETAARWAKERAEYQESLNPKTV